MYRLLKIKPNYPNDAHPLSRISDLLASVKDATYFSILDLHSRYWQIPVDPEDCQKTAFATQSGLYKFTRMPLRLKSTPATFQRAMEISLAGLTFEVCLCYSGDIIIFGQDIVKNLPPSRELKQLRSFLGLTSNHRWFVPQYVTVAAPLMRLMIKKFPN